MITTILLYIVFHKKILFCFGFLFWFFVLVFCFSFLFWFFGLVFCFGFLFGNLPFIGHGTQ